MRTVAVLLAHAAALAFGLYQAFEPVIESRFVRVQAERGDGMLNHYILEHSWQAVSNPDYRGSLFSPPCFHPEPNTLWYSEHFLGSAPAYWALRLGTDHVHAYQWWQILFAGLNFVTFALVARRLGCSHLLALVGAYLWAFGLAHLEQIKHQQMIPRLWMPLAVGSAWTFVLIPTLRGLSRLCLFAFLQCVTCVYTGWFLVMGLAVFVPVAMALRPGGYRELKQFARANGPRITTIAAGWTAALAIAFAPYIVVNRDVSRSYADCTGLMPTVAAWFTGPPGTPWDAVLSPLRETVTDECWLFCGFGIYLLMLTASVHLFLVRRQKRPPDMALAAAALLTAGIWVMLTLATDHEGRSLWELARFLPGATAIRCVSRVYVVVYLFGTVGALVWLTRVSNALPAPLRAILILALAAGVIFEQTGYRPRSFDQADFYTLADRTAGELLGADAGYVSPEYTDTLGERIDDIHGEVFAMWVGMRANVPVVNGYSGRCPPGEYPLGARVQDADLHKWLAGRFRGQLTLVTPDNPLARRVIAIE